MHVLENVLQKSVFYFYLFFVFFLKPYIGEAGAAAQQLGVFTVPSSSGARL